MMEKESVSLDREFKIAGSTISILFWPTAISAGFSATRELFATLHNTIATF
jgi:hypothetical protein